MRDAVGDGFQGCSQDKQCNNVRALCENAPQGCVTAVSQQLSRAPNTVSNERYPFGPYFSET